MNDIASKSLKTCLGCVISRQGLPKFEPPCLHRDHNVSEWILTISKHKNAQIHDGLNGNQASDSSEISSGSCGLSRIEYMPQLLR